MDCPAVSQLENIKKQMTETPAEVNDFINLMPELIAALTKITGQEFKSWKEYKKWWNKNEDSFEVDDSEKEKEKDKDKDKPKEEEKKPKKPGDQ